MLPGGGGTYSYRQLEQLWLAAGGPRRRAPLMAAIAMAESGGNADAKNPDSPAAGLWQIDGLPFAGNVFDPLTNARMAVAKYREQGLKAWETWISGAYKKFLQSGPVSAVHGPQALLDEAMQFEGTPYVWGGESPKGFDCSGLVAYALEKLGLKNVPRTSEEQWAWVQRIPRPELKPGDLVFFAGSDGTAASPGHVAIYAGGGQIIQALETGTNVGKFPLDSAGTPVGYGRVPGIGKADYTGSATGSTSGGGINWQSWLNDLTQGLENAALGPLAIPAGVISGTAAGLTGIASTLYSFEQHIAWFFVPSHWVRIIAGAAGAYFVIGGLIVMSRTGRPYSINAPGIGPVPAPGGELAPALGIAEVTLGAILLFVAFHNLPLSVDSFPAFISHLQHQVQSGGKAG